jgi:hypothetical protein
MTAYILSKFSRKHNICQHQPYPNQTISKWACVSWHFSGNYKFGDHDVFKVMPVKIIQNNPETIWRKKNGS